MCYLSSGIKLDITKDGAKIHQPIQNNILKPIKYNNQYYYYYYVKILF